MSQRVPAVGETVHGFKIGAVLPVPALRGSAVLAEHVCSGARLVHLANADSENLFSVSFPTPPPDDTGLPHIMEHAALGGSKRFPVKEPFFEMVKMSMATFINAMTASDHTMYPVASNVRKDLFNLAEVYFDAVFHPELDQKTFQREGWHWALERNDDPASPLQIKGIVYSEMKGVYSTPEGLLWRYGQHGLFPQTPLGLDSGGDPKAIPQLTYEQFLRFHRTLYHPSNARFFLYGDIPTEDYLAFLDERLAGFQRTAIEPGCPLHPRATAPRRLRYPYPVGPGESTSGKSYLAITWATGESTDPAEMTAWEVISTVLLGHEAAPLRKAIIDSKLGTDLLPSGSYEVGPERVFHVGIKGSEPERADSLLRLVEGTLAEAAERGMTRERVDMALQQLAYRHLEIQSLFPLRVMEHVNQSWLYGKDPTAFLRMGEHLEACRRRCETDPGFLGRTLRRGTLQNPYRLDLALVPDSGLQARDEAAFLAEMAARKAQFSAKEIEAIGRNAAEIDLLNSRPNSPEALATLPQLKVGDLPPKPRHIPTAIERVGDGLLFLRNDVFSNGVCYLDIDVDLSDLPEELYPFIPHYDDAFVKLGAAGQPFTRVAERKAACTGGLSASFGFLSHAVEADRRTPRLRFALKTLDGRMEEALAVLRDLVFELDPRDDARQRDVLRQYHAACRARLLTGGTAPATEHARRGLTPEGRLRHLMDGLPALERATRFIEDYGRRGEEIAGGIERLRDLALRRGRWTASFTGSDPAAERVRRTLGDWLGRLRAAPSPAPTPLPFPGRTPPTREGLAAPIQVAHCALVMPAPHRSHPDAPLLRIGAHLARFDYFLTEIRLKGSAYGAGCAYNGAAQTFELGSFRDPKPGRTLQVFAGFRDFVRRTDWSQTDVDRAIIGALKEAEQPIRPGEATHLALDRHVSGETRELREARYAAALRATPREVKRALLEQLEANEAESRVCVLAGREMIESANRENPGRELSLEEINFLDTPKER
jgi:Zn-dependent M16 (insulinase) family peptidase